MEEEEKNIDQEIKLGFDPLMLENLDNQQFLTASAESVFLVELVIEKPSAYTKELQLKKEKLDISSKIIGVIMYGKVIDE